MAATDLAIVNLALAHLGRSAIADLGGDDVAAVTASLFIDEARATLLRDHAWRWATATLELTRADDGGTPTPEYLEDLDWDYVYEYPVDDIVRIIRIRNATNRYKSVPYEIKYNADESLRVICTDEEDACADVVLLVDDPTVYPADFTEAFSWLLAYLLAPTLRADAKTQQRCYQGYQMTLARAKARDGNEHYTDPAETQENPYGDARG